ncbi:rhodanese-like domain-containing protein [Rudaeicoccus suwonensis]|uniref:Rhodanese-related sulfurtransferase n=1 Tax=Rudaeicoccus suwonensis TaxID=657409 RepID=A0A561E9X4_9MICO|nr:rhodanese-like domain-containing protein [Rudaeicoccus suwonensis]TWE12423.1 rhodanese-related sulfurtransferase [Rudaeicoccus suwonensis]
MSYAGDVTPEQAYDALRDDPDAVLIDVRTRAEWTYVGVPDLTALNKQVVCIEWLDFPDGQVNPDFVDQVRSMCPGSGAAYLLCRSGVRSVAAAEALTAAGVPAVYNVLEGFEGGLDEHGHRAVSGWKVAGLPWRQ